MTEKKNGGRHVLKLSKNNIFEEKITQFYFRGRANFGENRRKNGKTVPKNVPETAVHQGVKKQCFVAFPSQSQAVVGDIRKNEQILVT